MSTGSTAKHGRVRLNTGEILRLEAAAPGLITVMDGKVWLTRDDGEDIILGCGDSPTFAEGNVPVMSALDSPAFCVIGLSHRLAVAA
jgi:hypothetical protein